MEKKYLRTLMLAVLFLPFALQAQHTLTVADGTTTNSNVPIYGLYADDYLRCQTIYTAGALDAAATGYGMTGGAISSLTYYLSTPATVAWTGTWEVKMMEVINASLSGFLDMTNATTVYTGELDGTQPTLTITFTTPYTYQGGNLLIEVSQTTVGNWKSASFYGVTAAGASWQGYDGSAWASITGSAQSFMPKTTFTFTGGTEITCASVRNLAINASQTTPSSLTLTWTDTTNTGASYSVYDMSDNTLIDSGITGTTYTVTGLDDNTEYTFGVEANCSATDASVLMTVSGRTSCHAMSLPWTCGFEADELVSTTQATALPWCSFRYSAPSSVSYPDFPFSYQSNTYSHTGNRSLRYYGSTSSYYPDTMAIILPQVDVNSYPMAGNRLIFWSKMETASYSKNVYVGSMTDPSDITTLVVFDSILVNGTTHTKYIVSLANASGAYIVLMVLKGNGSLYIDDVTIEELPSCLEVSNLRISNTTENSITLKWVDPNPNASFTIYNMADNSVIGTVTDTTFTVQNLTPGTSYAFGVQANCTAGDAAIVPVSTHTDCATETMPWSENFDNWTSKSFCWSFLSGAFNGGNGPATASASAWAINSTYGSNITLSGKALVMNVYSTNRYWAVSPTIHITDNNATLSVDVAVAAWSSAEPNYDANDTLAFAISTDNGSTFTPLLVLDNTQINALGNSYSTIYVPVIGYNGQNVRFAIFAGSAVSGGDNRIAIDNVSVGEFISCMPVLNLAANNITDQTATLTWTSDASSFNVYAISQNDTTLVQNVTDTSLVLTGLSAMTYYTYGVRVVCSDGESPIVFVSFHTACIAATLPFTETFETNSGTLGCWTTDGPGTWSFGVGDYSTGTGAYEGARNAKITHGVTGHATKLISPVLGGVNNGLLLDFAHIQRPWSGDIDELRVYYRVAADSAWQMMAELTAAAATWTVESVVIPGTVYQVAFEYTDRYGYGLGIDSVVFTAMSGDYCFPVSNFAVDTATENTVSLSWIDVDNSGATYTIYDMADNSVIASGINATNYEVTGLTSLTGYTFGIVANCSATDVSHIVTVNAITACSGATCNITITGEDSYGDGWNGNVINIMQAGVIIGTFTFHEGSSSTESFPVCSDAQVSFMWDNVMYPEETSFVIFDGSNNSVFSAFGHNLTEGTIFFTLHNACPICMPASNLTLDTATENSVTISWTGDAASYDVYNGETLVANVTTTSYTFTGLTPATSYVFGVQAFCSATDSASVATITATTSSPDSLTVILDTDDPMMGTTNPVPGVYSIAVGDSSVFTAVPNPGYNFLYWIESVTIAGITASDTIYADTIFRTVIPMMANITLSLTAYFEVDEVVYYNVSVTSSDELMGSVSSDVPLGQVAENTVVTVTATPTTGCGFFYWLDEAGLLVSEANPYSFTVTEDITLIAFFATLGGINDIDASNVLIYANKNTITVRGAEGHDVFVYDMNGRCIYHQADAKETENISMSSAGIYMVRVDNAIFKKVVIVK